MLIKQERITTALLLAAGMGNRLQPLTNDMPKCLTRINGMPILEQLVDCLHQYDFKRLIVVVGYFEQSIRDFLDEIAGDLTIEYIVSSEYKTTNNIDSLWLARDIIKEPFLLIESDLIFDPSLLEDMLLPDKIAVSRRLPWMHGTTVSIGKHSPRCVTAFHLGAHQNLSDTTYKTVNIYSLSLPSWQRIVKRLDAIFLRAR